METYLSVKMFFSILLMVASCGGVLYFVYAYNFKRGNSREATPVLGFIWILFVVFLLLLSQYLFESGIARWLMVWVGLICTGIPMVIRCVRDSKREDSKDHVYSWKFHALFFLCLTLVPFTRFQFDYLGKLQENLKLERSEVVTIKEWKIVVHEEPDFVEVDSSLGGFGSFYNGKEEVEWLHIISTDNREFEITRLNKKNYNYKRLYPLGDTLRVYKGKPLKPRR